MSARWLRGLYAQRNAVGDEDHTGHALGSTPVDHAGPGIALAARDTVVARLIDEALE